MGGIRFDEQVAAALEALPDELRAAMSNVELVVEDENPDDPDVYGLYTGIPLTERDSGYAGVLPDKIEIYRIPLEEEFGHDPDLLVEEIRITVIHELAHHFGIDDDRLEDLGWGVGKPRSGAQRPRRRRQDAKSSRRSRRIHRARRAARRRQRPREAQQTRPAYRKPRSRAQRTRPKAARTRSPAGEAGVSAAEQPAEAHGCRSNRTRQDANVPTG